MLYSFKNAQERKMIGKKVWLILVALMMLPMTAAACGFGEKVAEGY